VNGEKYQNITDNELLEKFYLDRDNEWLGILFKRYTLLLLGVCIKYLKDEDEAKDSVQQIFLKTITELNKYRVEYFKSWIYMVAKNHCLMKLRDRQGKYTADLTDNISSVHTEQEHEERLRHIERNNTLELMNVALKELGEEQRQCLISFYLQKKSYQEIAEASGFSMLQVKSYIQNGKRNLKIILDKKINQQQTRGSKN
jgi:RNA polymerase sigma-70 factor (ECF subfamily)